MKTTIYFHRDKGENFEIVEEAEKQGIKQEFIDKLYYLGYEIEIEVDINLQTGEIKIISLEGVNISEDINL